MAEELNTSNLQSCMYDPCREWLRLLVAVFSLFTAIAAIYPLNLGVRCYYDHHDNGSFDVEECSTLQRYEYTTTLMSLAVVIQILMVLAFFYACRHEFCGVKRSYDAPFTLSCHGSNRDAVTPVNH